jgi:hypothetical protein
VRIPVLGPNVAGNLPPERSYGVILSSPWPWSLAARSNSSGGTSIEQDRSGSVENIFVLAPPIWARHSVDRLAESEPSSYQPVAWSWHFLVAFNLF